MGDRLQVVPRRAVDPVEAAELATVGGEGVLLFETGEEVRKKRRRWRRVALSLLGFMAFWLLALFDPDPGDDMLLGLIMIEAFLAAPTVYALYRWRILRRLEERLGRDVSDQLADAAERSDAERDVARAVLRIGRVVARLPEDLRAREGEEALRVATRFGEEWRRLVSRLDDLRDLPSTPAIEARITAGEAEVADLEAAMDDLTVSLVDLADAADDDDVASLTHDLHSAEERMRLLAESLREMRTDPTDPGSARRSAARPEPG